MLKFENCMEIMFMAKRAKAVLLFVLAAFLSFVGSVYLWFNGHKDQGMFVGLWVPSILSFGSLLISAIPSHDE